MVGIGQYADPPFNNATVIIHVDGTTDVPGNRADLALGAAYPNPFNPQTQIPVTLARDGFVRLEVFDAAGRRVRTLHHGHLAAGQHHGPGPAETGGGGNLQARPDDQESPAGQRGPGGQGDRPREDEHPVCRRRAR